MVPLERTAIVCSRHPRATPGTEYHTLALISIPPCWSCRSPQQCGPV